MIEGIVVIALIVSILVITKRSTPGQPPGPTIPLKKGANELVYPGPTASVASALNNIGPRGENVTVIVWYKSGGDWQYYQFIPTDFTQGNLHVMHEGYKYAITVQRDIVWQLLPKE